MPYELSRLIGTGRRKRPVVVPLKRPFALEHERALFRILRGIIEFWQAQAKSELTTDAIPDVTRVNTARLIDSTREALLKWLAGLAAFERRQWVAEVKRRTGVNIDNMAASMEDDPDVLAALLWAMALAIDLDAQIRQKLTAASAESRSLNRSPKETLQAVAAVFAQVRRRAEFIAHDQTQKIAAKIVQKQQEEAGIGKYIWNHSFQKNPRRHHVERQGNVYEWAKPPRDGHPGHAYNCRCTASAYIEAA